MPSRKGAKRGISYLIPDEEAPNQQPAAGASSTVIHQYASTRADGSRHVTNTSHIVPEAPESAPLPHSDASTFTPTAGDASTAIYELDLAEYAREQRDSDDPMAQWADSEGNHRETYLAELLRLEGRGNHIAVECMGCGFAACFPAMPRLHNRGFLYSLFLAIDANFRMRRKDVSSEKKDPGLADGLSFFCETDVYMTHVKKHWNDRQARSRCVAHDAVDKPDREARGTASSGIGAVDCARHNMKRPLSVGDTQLGERYINMDFMFFRSLEGTELVYFFVSYDIACQWHINIWDRMSSYNNELLSIDNKTKYFVFLVPKFHLPAHIEECNMRFSFNLTRNVGMTDGEAPERGWSAANPLAGSTMNMGPGSRRDALDDFFNDQNHKKIISLGKTMLKKVKEAAPRVIETKQALISLESGFESGTIKTWSDMATAWEGAAAQRPNPFPSPFESKGKGDQLPRVRRELAEEAARREATGTEDPGMIRNDMHVTELIAGGLHLEEQHRAGGNSERDGCTREIMTYELGCASGEANEALALIRQLLLVRTHMLLQKDRYARGVKANTRSNTQIATINERVRRAVAQYQAAWRALQVLGEELRDRTWAETLKELKADDVRGMPRKHFGDPARQRGSKAASGTTEEPLVLRPEGEESRAKRSRGRARDPLPLSWIWLQSVASRQDGESEEMDEALRIEWARTRARALRWEEELDLLEEEMRRISEFLIWRGIGGRSVLRSSPVRSTTRSGRVSGHMPCVRLLSNAACRMHFPVNGRRCQPILQMPDYLKDNVIWLEDIHRLVKDTFLSIDKEMAQARHPRNTTCTSSPSTKPQTTSTLGWGITRAFGTGVMKWGVEMQNWMHENVLGRKPHALCQSPPYFTAEPEITVTDVQSGDFMIMASDGFWECLTNEEAVGLVGLWLNL
ncbi:CxC2 domain-containing protein [Mycena chlorophos]|uniref:CxC2 domain-containing protein n=1 Tax=Mycena chlorophos TaxID=658473 RepID=A0A8H6VVV5_MYCCL|nr:CxC2 domain-containing protein [Mycena chlorophos]